MIKKIPTQMLIKQNFILSHMMKINYYRKLFYPKDRYLLYLDIKKHQLLKKLQHLISFLILL